MEKEQKKSGKQGRARSWGGLGRLLKTFLDFVGITSNPKNNPIIYAKTTFKTLFSYALWLIIVLQTLAFISHSRYASLNAGEMGGKLPASNTQEQNVIAFAEHFEDITEAGHGMFFDFSATPELEKPVLDYLVNGFGWTLERSFFIKKPEE